MGPKPASRARLSHVAQVGGGCKNEETHRSLMTIGWSGPGVMARHYDVARNRGDPEHHTDTEGIVLIRRHRSNVLLVNLIRVSHRCGLGHSWVMRGRSLVDSHTRPAKAYF